LEVKVKSSQLRELTKEELVQKRLEIEEELFNLRLQKKLKELDNPLRLRTLRREIARIKTLLREDQLKIGPLVNTREEKKD
jgi:large subunit ribosomal protein L29